MLYHSLFHYTIMLHHKLTDDSCCNLFAKERKLPYHIFWKNIKVCDNSISIKFIYNLISANHSFYQKFEYRLFKIKNHNSDNKDSESWFSITAQEQNMHIDSKQ